MPNQVCLASIEVDGRQKYIFETDKLKEMLGASQVMDHTRLIAQNAESLNNSEKIFSEPVHVFQPVSGEVKLWCEPQHKAILCKQIWAFKEWLSARGLQHTVTITQTEAKHLTGTDQDCSLTQNVHEKLIKAARVLKNNKNHIDARPRLALFAACQIHGEEPANRYEAHDSVRQNRRSLISERAHQKLKQWESVKKEFYRENLEKPFKARIKALLPDTSIDTQRAITFFDLTEDKESGQAREDQYIGFVCADGDGMGKLLGKLNWNQNLNQAPKDSTWNQLKPWERNRAFAIAYDQCVRNAFGKALAEALIPDEVEAQEYKRKIEDGQNIYLPLLPQLLGGDDLWMVADREMILKLCCHFGALYAEEVKQNPTIKDLLSVYQQVNQDEAPDLTISMGVAFAKASYPATQMIDLAEQLLKKAKELRKGLLWERKITEQEGCFDFHWIESSRSESLEEARKNGWRYQHESETMLLSTRPWSLSETEAFTKAASTFSQLPRRKREQLEQILRLGYTLSKQAWKSWLQGLNSDEQEMLGQVNETLPEDLRLKNLAEDPWILLKDKTYSTPWLDLLVMLQILGKEGKR